MACDCIKRMGKLVRKKYGDYAYINAIVLLDGTTRFQLTASYRKKKRNGEYATKESTLYMLSLIHI